MPTRILHVLIMRVCDTDFSENIKEVSFCNKIRLLPL